MNEKLFEIIAESRSRAETYDKAIDLIEKEKNKAVGKAMADQYDMLRKLHDSENCAGWERRHDCRITSIRSAMSAIADQYEKYLP